MVKNNLKFLEKISKELEYKEKSSMECNMLSSLMANGYSQDALFKKYSGSINNLASKLEFAASRNSIRKKYSKYDELWLDSYSASYSTPENVGIYRSLKLKGHDIADLGSGGGMQAIFLSKNSRVTGIEINPERNLMSKLNCIPYESDCTFILGDATLSGEVLKDKDTIYSDPFRSRVSDERRIDILEPSPLKILSLYGHRIQNFVFDLPPMMRRENMSMLKGELEYISVNGRISRLTIYSMDNAENKTTAYDLSTGVKFESFEYEEPEKTDEVKSLMFVPDESLFYSGLHGTYCKKIGLSILQVEKRKALYTGETELPGFMGETYRVEKTCEFDSLKENLVSSEGGKVIIRFDTPDYYKVKETLEKELSGDKVIHVFKINDRAILCSAN